MRIHPIRRTGIPKPARPRMPTRRAALWLGLAALAFPTTLTAEARAPQVSHRFQLILVEQKGCAGCAAWLREIGPVYAQTMPDMPLIRVDIHTGHWPEGIVIGARPNVTPTFLVLRDGIEVERLYGYAGPARFWPALRAALG